MAAALVILLLAVSVVFPVTAHAQEGPGCGPTNVTFDVSTKKVQPPAPVPALGKAIVYFLQDDLKYNARPRPTTRFGIDGTWVGATHANSYFYVSVDPGDHHVCANWQSDVTGLSYIGPKRSTAAVHFTAEAGKSYYFRARDVVYSAPGGPIVSEPAVELSRLDSDEAQVIINSFSLNSSHPKK
jgi:hypothetical protein